MSAQMNELLFEKRFLILGIGRLVTTEYRIFPSIRYSAEPSNRTEYRFSPIINTTLYLIPLGLSSSLYRFSTHFRDFDVNIAQNTSWLQQPFLYHVISNWLPDSSNNFAGFGTKRGAYLTGYGTQTKFLIVIVISTF